MGNHKDHREPRQHRHDDDTVSFAERSSEPSYFLRSSTVTAPAVDADVILFKTSKGFGFVKLPEGIEAHPGAAGGREPRCFRGKASQVHGGRKSKRSPGLSGAGGL